MPNSYLADNAVTNFSQMTYRRISWVIGLEYGTSVDQLRRIRDEIEAYILANDAFARPPSAAVFVRIDKFSQTSIDMLIDCFTWATDKGDWLKAKEGLIFAIKTIVAAAEASFALPASAIHPAAPTATDAVVPPGSANRDQAPAPVSTELKADRNTTATVPSAL